MDQQTKITGGKVTFGLTVCPKQYESKRTDVELSFSVSEGDDYQKIFDKACNAAMIRCREMVGLQAPTKPTVEGAKSLFEG